MLYHGLEVLAGGATLVRMVLGATGAFLIDRRYAEASYFAAAGALLTVFGFMRGETVGFAVRPSVALAYATVATFLFAIGRMPAEPEINAKVVRRSNRRSPSQFTRRACARTSEGEAP